MWPPTHPIGGNSVVRRIHDELFEKVKGLAHMAALARWYICLVMMPSVVVTVAVGSNAGEWRECKCVGVCGPWNIIQIRALQASLSTLGKDTAFVTIVNMSIRVCVCVCVYVCM